jgi:hypothetical protein
MRKLSWFSCGAASAVATKLTLGPVLAIYCDTGAEHPDNFRFRTDCEKWFGYPVTILKSNEYQNTWHVWEKTKWLAGIDGARCTVELKVKPRLLFQRPNDIHVFGYTSDALDIARAKRLRATYSELIIETPLIERGLTKAACLAILGDAGIDPPILYSLGFTNNNCIPCVKATSPNYWALVRKHFPEQFQRMAKLSRQLNVRLCRINDERRFIDEIPLDQPIDDPLQPSCDFLCHLAEQDIGGLNADRI